MEKSGNSDLARSLMENFYRGVEQEYNAGRVSIYTLADPALPPGCLAEIHRIGNAYYSIEIAYGPWDSDANLLRVITWYHLPGQEEVIPENYLGFNTSVSTADEA